LTGTAAVIKSPKSENMSLNKIERKIKNLAEKYHLQLIYAFGSRAKEALDYVHGKKNAFRSSQSDVDIGVKPKKHLRVEELVKIALFFEDIFNVPRVDVVMLTDAPVFLALEIVQGELLYARDDRYEAEYQLYIMRRASELARYETMKIELILEMQK
jgi:predicted nucleotidyltransferase